MLAVHSLDIATMSKKIAPEIEKAEHAKTMSNVIKALQTVAADKQLMARRIAQGFSAAEIVSKFNQAGKDFFVLLKHIINEVGENKDYNLNGYEKLFHHAISIRQDWPIDKFTLMILQFAPQVYEEDEQFFLSVEIPDQNVRINNEFGIIKTEAFKELWLKTNDNRRDELKDNCLLLVSFAHAYFLKMIRSSLRV